MKEVKLNKINFMNYKLFVHRIKRKILKSQQGIHVIIRSSYLVNLLILLVGKLSCYRTCSELLLERTVREDTSYAKHTNSHASDVHECVMLANSDFHPR